MNTNDNKNTKPRDYQPTIEEEIEPYNSLNIESILDKAFGNRNDKDIDGKEIKDGN